MSKRPYFQGKSTIPASPPELPVVDPNRMRGGEGYLASGDLAAAVDVAITLGMPLLLTGEPGSGKSRLADRVACELGLLGPYLFAVKSETRGNDLFYSFDTVGRFHAASLAGNTSLPDEAKPDIDPRRYITFNAMGTAILQAKARAYATDALKLPDTMKAVREHPGDDQRRRAVVLIDEIDKAPRDVPNDILNEIEELSFRIPEFEQAQGGEVNVSLDPDELAYRPLVIITSNSEKALPEAFLRRCVFHHLRLPPFSEDEDRDPNDPTIEQIVASRLLQRYPDDQHPKPDLFKDAIAFFRHLRSDAVHLGRPPSLAELLNWLELLLLGDMNDAPLPETLTKTLQRDLEASLFKTAETQQQATRLYADWRATRQG